MQSNILIDDDGRACIAGFSLSTILTTLGEPTFSTSQKWGGLRWADPGLFNLNTEDDEDSPRVPPTTRSDIYSFGSIMLQILTGDIPYYYYTSVTQVLLAILQGRTPRRPQSAIITDRRWEFIQRCWSTVGKGRLRPSGEQLVGFVRRELAEIM
ncbi:kinase-like domain-containing protein [Melanogaster broomeanus]|nr:kinase-like domain-containing protein [Melanogaster broomeanus]KAF9230203.1 kinase-like domain-containing protein [Melanogaster broomeanus]